MARTSARVKEVEDAKNKELEDLREQLATSEKEKEEAEMNNACLLAKKGKRPDKNDPTVKAICSIIKDKIWRTVKFINSDDQELKVAHMVLTELDNPKYLGDTPEAKKHRKEWIALYGQEVTKALNEHRSYVVAQIKKEVTEFMDNHAGNPPQTGTIMAMLQRKEKMTEAQLEILVWWWDKVLPKATGNTKDWNDQKRYYNTISSCAPPNAPNKLHVTPSTEAFAVLSYEGFKTKWKSLYDLKKQHPGKRIILKKPEYDANRKQINKAPVVNAESVEVFDEKFFGKYTVWDAGQSKYGGYTEAGLIRFNTLKGENKKARDTDKGKEVEEEILEAVRDKLEKKAASWELEKKIKKQKVKKTPTAVTEIDTFGDEE